MRREEGTVQAASSGGHEAVVKLLLEKGAEVNAVTFDNVSDPGIQKVLREAN